VYAFARGAAGGWAVRALQRLRSLTPFHTTSRRFLQPVSGLSGFTPR